MAALRRILHDKRARSSEMQAIVMSMVEKNVTEVTASHLIINVSRRKVDDN